MTSRVFRRDDDGEAARAKLRAMVDTLPASTIVAMLAIAGDAARPSDGIAAAQENPNHAPGVGGMPADSLEARRDRALAKRSNAWRGSR